MFSPAKLGNIIFFDVETVTQYPDLDTFSNKDPESFELWKQKDSVLRNKHSGADELSENELYHKYGPLFGQYGKVISIAYGMVKVSDDREAAFKINSSSSKKETVVLDKFKHITDKHKNNNKYSYLCGHNIKGFDVSFLGQRYLANGIWLPKHLQMHDKKPWEVNHIDTSEIWSFGNYQRKFVKLEEMALALNIDTPKDDIGGEDVNRVFWKEDDLDRIDTYCKKDVKTVIEIVLNLSGVNSITEID